MEDIYRVTGIHPVSGTDPGGTVELDPERVDIPALLESGAVEPVKAKAPGGLVVVKAKKPQGGDE